MSINWHTKSKGPKKKYAHFSRGRINPGPYLCPGPALPTLLVNRVLSIIPYALRSVRSFNSPTVCIKGAAKGLNIETIKRFSDRGDIGF